MICAAPSTRQKYSEDWSPKPARRRNARGVVVGRGVEVQLGVGHRLSAVVVAQHLLEVADAHVVGHDGEVLAPELLLGDLQIADGRRQRLAWVEAVVGSGQPGEQSGAPARARRRCRSRSSSRRLRARSMCIPSSERPVSARICVSPAAEDGSAPATTSGRPGALDEHQRLDQRRIDAGAPRRGVDQRPGRSRRAPRWPARRRGSW